MVLKACSQTGHYAPQSSTVWVRVGECVCERIGRCSPPRWKCPKISQQRICHLHNSSFLFFHTFEFFFTFFHIERFCCRPTCCKRRQQPGQQNASKTVTLWFGDVALARRGTGSTTVPVSLYAAKHRRPHPLSTLQTKVEYRAQVWQRTQQSPDWRALNANTFVTTFSVGYECNRCI